LEITVFGKTFVFGEQKRTQTTFVTLPHLDPRGSIVKPNERLLRNFSRKAIPSRAISLIRDGILAQKWKLEVGDRVPLKAVKAIENVILRPNPTDGYRQFWGQVINETLIGDNGAAEVVFTGNSKHPMELYPVNGFSLEYVRGFFDNPESPRFVQVISGQKKSYLYDSDVLYLQHLKTVDHPFGLSPIEASFTELISLIDAQEYGHRQASNAMPKHAINLGEAVNQGDIVAFRKYFREEVYGRGETPIIGGTKGASTLDMGAEGDEAMFLKWQSHLITIIALAFSIDPKKLGQGSNTDRSTVEEQNESLLHEAIRPYCLLLQDEINKKIIAPLGVDVKFSFEFEDTLEQQAKKQKIIVEQWNSNAITLREYRKALGLPEGDSEYLDVTQGEMKSMLNQKYAVQGGFNGLGQNRKEDIDKVET